MVVELVMKVEGKFVFSLLQILTDGSKGVCICGLVFRDLPSFLFATSYV